MAKKRLNKKVALIGSLVFVLLGLAVVGIVLYKSRDPHKYVKDGDAALLAKDYKTAERYYHKAREMAGSDSLRIELLFKLADLYIEMGQWQTSAACWAEINRIDPKNIKARYNRLKHMYLWADSGYRQSWQEVRQQVSDFLEVADADLLAQQTAQWETFEEYEPSPAGQRLEPYLYQLRGRAAFEMARIGAVTDKDKTLADAIDDFNNVLKLQPDNVDVYWYLAQAEITKGEILASRGDLGQRQSSAEQAVEILERAIRIAGDNVKAYTNLLTIKAVIARKGTFEQRKEQIQALESEYLSLVKRFASSAEAFAALAYFYADSPPSTVYLDKAIQAIEKAIELDSNNVEYQIAAANLKYRKYSLEPQKKQQMKTEIYNAMEIAEGALKLPGAQEVSGPRQWRNRTRRVSLCSFLAKCYIEQVIEPTEELSESQTKEWLTKAEQVVIEIEQLYGSGEEPGVVKWQGMLELAKGDVDNAIRKLYATYEQLKASGQADAELAYALAKIFKDSTETGAAVEFLASAINAGIDMVKPQVRLDYVEAVLKLRAWPIAISNINVFEAYFGPNDRSRTLRALAYIGARQFDEAEELLAGMPSDDPEVMGLQLELVQAKIRQIQTLRAQRQTRENLGVVSRGVSIAEGEGLIQGQPNEELLDVELQGYMRNQVELVEKVLQIEPSAVKLASIVAACNSCIADGNISKARAIVDRFLERFPDDATVLFQKRLLSEPEPNNISEQRRREIEEQTIMDVAEPVKRAVSLGSFYQRNNEPGKAIAEYTRVLELPLPSDSEEYKATKFFAASNLLEVAAQVKDWDRADKVLETARQENLDGCGGKLFAARLAIAKGQHQDALAGLNEVLKQRPVFSLGFLFRGTVNAVLGNEHASIGDIRRASYLNPLDGQIAKALASALYYRNQKLGGTISSEQITETRAALDTAMALNPGDWQLLSFYAEYISTTEPLRALAIRQNLQINVPSIENAVLLGELAMKMALSEEDDVERREALFEIADSAFKQAQKMNPQDKLVLSRYAEFYRVRGELEKAGQLLQESGDKQLMWLYHFQSGQFEKAKEILEQLYQSDPKDKNVVKGLLFVAGRIGDTEAIKRYSEEFLLLDDSIDTRLMQIQSYLRGGLIKEAESKLQSLKELYPGEPKVVLLEAWLAMKQGRLREALELTNQGLEKSFKDNENNAVAWQLRGEVNRLIGNYDQAIIDLKKGKQLAIGSGGVTTDILSVQMSLAKAYMRAGRVEDAIIELKGLIEHPQSPMEAKRMLEQIYWRLGRKDALKEFYQQMLTRYPDDIHWYNQTGALALATKDYGRAEQLYTQAWQKSQKYGQDKVWSEALDALDGYFRVLILGEKLDKLFEEANDRVDGKFAPIAFFRMAEAKMKLGDKVTAVEYCRKAIDKAGEDETLGTEILKRTYSLLGYEDMEKICSKRLSEKPDSLTANWAMFNLTVIKEQYNKALQYIDKCLAILGPDDDVRMTDYTIKKVQVLEKAYSKSSDKNYLNKAITEYESLLAKMPNNISVLNNLAYLLALNNEKLDEALGYAERIYEAKPNDPTFLDTYAFVLYKNGKHSEAAQFLRMALQQYEQYGIPAPAEVYEHLGQVTEELGLLTEATAAYEQALDVGDDILPDEEKDRLKKTIRRLSQQGGN